MVKSIAYDKAYVFAKDIIAVYKRLKSINEYVIAQQLLRCGTSIGANIAEANGAISRKDFSSKVSIAYKETLESRYWISLLFDSEYLTINEFEDLNNKVNEISKILFTILKSTNRISTKDKN